MTSDACDPGMAIIHSWIGGPARYTCMKHMLILVAVVLVIVWVVLRVALAVTSVALHILWILAIIFAIIWLINRLRG